MLDVITSMVYCLLARLPGNDKVYCLSFNNHFAPPKPEWVQLSHNYDYKLIVLFIQTNQTALMFNIKLILKNN